MDFTGKVAIVTGSAVGIGKGIAIALAKRGANIAGFDIKSVENEEMVQEVRDLGRRGLAIKCDISNNQEVKASVEKVINAFGRIDILINNAGVANVTPMIDADFNQTLEMFDRNYAVNARGTFVTSLAVIPTMLKQGNGDIINIITNHVKKDRFPTLPLYHAYDASKYAQLSLTESMAEELKPKGIRVNGICPAATDTPMLRKDLGMTPTPEIMEKITGTASLMKVEEVATAVVNILNWGPDGKVGQTPLLVHREDCENLADEA